MMIQDPGLTSLILNIDGPSSKRPEPYVRSSLAQFWLNLSGNVIMPWYSRHRE